MEQALDSAPALASPSVAVVAREAGKRLSYIDMTKVVLTALVVLVHTAVTYGSAGDWTFVDPGANDMLSAVLLSLFGIYCQSFFMALFFFFSGYFTPGSYDRKRIVRFWKDRIVHLALPMAAYTWGLSRVPNYLAQVGRGVTMPSFWRYSLDTFWRYPDKGPTWFLFALLAFTVGYTAIRLTAQALRLDRPAWLARIPAPSTPTLLVSALVMAALMYGIAQFMGILDAYEVFGVFGLMMAFMPFYITFFAAGILAYRNDWLAKMSTKMLQFWGRLSVALIVIFPVVLIGSGVIETGLDPYLAGASWRCAVMCLWLATACVAFSVSLTLWMRGHVKQGSRLAKAGGANTFTIYLIHPLVLVAIAVGMTAISLHPLIKFVIASASTLVICYGLAEVLRRVPVIRRVL